MLYIRNIYSVFRKIHNEISDPAYVYVHVLIVKPLSPIEMIVCVVTNGLFSQYYICMYIVCICGAVDKNVSYKIAACDHL